MFLSPSIPLYCPKELHPALILADTSSFACVVFHFYCLAHIFVFIDPTIYNCKSYIMYQNTLNKGLKFKKTTIYTSVDGLWTNATQSVTHFTFTSG